MSRSIVLLVLCMLSHYSCLFAHASETNANSSGKDKVEPATQSLQLDGLETNRIMRVAPSIADDLFAAIEGAENDPARIWSLVCNLRMATNSTETLDLFDGLDEQAFVILSVVKGTNSSHLSYASIALPVRRDLFIYRHTTQWFPWGHWGTRVVFIHPTTLDGHRIEYAARQPTGKPDEMVTSNSLLFSVNGKYQFKQIKHDHTEVATAIIGAGLTIGLKDLFDVASTANLETEPETFAKNLQVVMTDGSVQASEAVPVVNRLIARHNESLGPAGQLEPVANLAEIEELIKQLQPYLEIQAALTPTPDYTVAVLDYTNRVQNPYGHSQVELTLSPSLKGSNAISEYLDAQLRQKEDMARIKARIADLEATYLTTTTDLPRIKADLDTAKEQSAFTEAYYKTRLEKLRSPNPVRYDKLQAGGDRWSFSLAYAIRDADEVGYTVDNGVISIDEDSQKKTPAFLTANYHLVPVPNMDDYTFWQRLTLVQPYAFLGFRTEITEFEPVGGLGITLRLFKSFQLQGWAGWVYSSQTSLQGAELGDAVTENNLSTDEDFEFVAGVAIGWTPKK